MSAQEVAELREFAPGLSFACLEKARWGGINAINSIATDECYEMAPARTWRGIWRNDFEGVRFCPEPMKECGYETPGDVIWLSYSEDLGRQGTWPEPGADGLYHVEFVGRLTAKRGSYGHEGYSNHEVVVDRIISLRALSDPNA